MRLLRTTVFEKSPGLARVDIIWKRSDDTVVEHTYEFDTQQMLDFATKLNGVANMMLRHAPRPEPA